MDPNSTTLRFEIPEQQLNRIEDDAFLFNVPAGLRGKFDRVEFVAVRGPAGSHEFSSGSTIGSRGSANGPEAIDRFVPNPSDRFGTAKEAPRWNFNSPQPRPGLATNEPEFSGPVIDQEELNRRRLASLEPNRGLNQPSDFIPRTDQTIKSLDTSQRFQTTDVEPRRRSFDQNWNQPEGRSGINQPTKSQPFQESVAERQLRVVQQQLAQAEADKKLLQQNNSQWMQHAELLDKQKNSLSEQLKTVSDREFAKQGVNTQPVNFQGQYPTDASYLNRIGETAKGIGRTFGSQREHFQTPGPVYTQPTAAPGTHL